MAGGSDDATDGGGGFAFTIAGEDGNQPRVKLLWQMSLLCGKSVAGGEK